MKIDVSFVVPVYNSENYLDDLFRSFERLTFRHEVIFVDDCSEDNSIEILSSYVANPSHKARLIRNEENLGLSASRNKGLFAAKGTYVQFLDSDDYLDKARQNELVTRVLRDQIDLNFFDAIAFPDNPNMRSKTAEISDYYSRHGKYRDISSGPDLLAKMIEGKDWLPSACMFIFKRKLAVAAGIEFRVGELMEDHAFTVQLTLSARTASHSHLPVYRRRVRFDSITQDITLEMQRVQGLLVASAQIVEMAAKPEIDQRVRVALVSYVRTILSSCSKRLTTFDKDSAPPAKANVRRGASRLVSQILLKLRS